MFTCMICRFDAVLDDVAVRGPADRCVCVRCFARETGTERPFTKELRRAVDAVLSECCTA